MQDVYCGKCLHDRGELIVLHVFSFQRDRQTSREYGLPGGTHTAAHCSFCQTERHIGAEFERVRINKHGHFDIARFPQVCDSTGKEAKAYAAVAA